MHSIRGGARLVAFAASAALALAGLTACSGGSAPAATEQAQASTAPAHEPKGGGDHAGVFEMHDAWVKAAKQGGMTALFGMVHNHTDADLTIVSASTDVAKMAQLHVVETDSDGSSKMVEKKDGFAVPKGGEFMLRPGGAHVMLMGLTKDLMPGDTVSVTLTLSNGNKLVVEAPVKEYTGAQETYRPGDEHEHGGHDHGNHTHGSDDH